MKRLLLIVVLTVFFISCGTDAPVGDQNVDDDQTVNDSTLDEESDEEQSDDAQGKDETHNDDELEDVIDDNEENDEEADEKADEKIDEEVSDDTVVADGLDESFISENKGLSFKMISEISSDIGDLKFPETIKSSLKLEDDSTISLEAQGSHIMATSTKLYIVLAGEEDAQGTKYAARVEIPVDNLKALTEADENMFNKDGNFLIVDVIKQWKKDDSVIRCPVQINSSPFSKDAFFVLSENMSWIGGEEMGVMMNSEMVSDREEIAKAYGSLFYYETCSCATIVGSDETPRDCSFDDVGETPPECMKDIDCDSNSDGKTVCDLDQSSSSFLTCIAPVEVTNCTADPDCAGNTDGKVKCDTTSASSTFNKCVFPHEICTEITFSNIEWRGKNSFNGYVYRAQVSPNLGLDQESEIGEVVPDYIYLEFYGSDYSSPVSFDLSDVAHSDYDTTNEAVLVKENETSSYYGRLYYQSEGTLEIEQVQGTGAMTEHSKGKLTGVKLVEMDNSTDPRCLRISGSWDTTETVVDPCAGISCSGHGECKVVADNSVCDCDEGYSSPSGDKTVCEAAGTVGDTCSGPMITVTASGAHTFTTTSDYTNTFAPSSECSSASANTSFDYVFKVEISARSSVVIDVTAFSSTVVPDTVIYLSSTCGNSETCNDDKTGSDYLSKIDTTLDAGTYYVVLDTFYGDYGAYSVDVTITGI